MIKDLMRFLKIFGFLLLLFITVLACHNHKSLTNAKPILEITQDARGMWDVTGKTLFLRVYNNGIVEFELPKEKTQRTNNKAEDVNVLKRAELTVEKLQEIIRLLESSDFNNLQETYQRKCCCTDQTLNFEIKFRNYNNQWKNINLNGYCRVDELTNPQPGQLPDVPKQLSELIVLANSLR